MLAFSIKSCWAKKTRYDCFINIKLLYLFLNIGLHARNPLFGVSDQVMPKLACSARKFACSKLVYDTFLSANNKGADQPVRLHRLVCIFVVRKPPKQVFVCLDPFLSFRHRSKFSRHVDRLKCSHMFFCVR